MDIKDIKIKIADNRDIDLLCDFEEQTLITEPDIWISEFDKMAFKKNYLHLIEIIYSITRSF